MQYMAIDDYMNLKYEWTWNFFGFARSGGSLSPPGTLLATDRSKAVVLV